MDNPNKIEEPDKQEIKRNNGRFVKGVSGNPAGRPKGKTLKEWAREKLMNMTDKEREAFIKQLPKDILWRMAEGNPHQSTDSDVRVTIPTPISDVLKDAGIQEDSSAEE